ncbi:MFS transporter [Paenibacillus sedimenti]|uniref:MFS transporter n=1 Tax=Paenibacillus sedimenti TaxID=2770274 RepID=A0A926KRQ4_9BACL|nr:MFS transporter [Paenibacillus sedimenti]MBD0382098.1 MFS transporter [Paenibacillus sedimenti]
MSDMKITAASPQIQGLWGNQNFIKLWISQTASQFGAQIVLLGIPLLAVYTLQATPVQMGYLRAAEYLPFLLFGLLAGVFSDRFARKPILVASNLFRSALLLLIPVLSFFHSFQFVHLLVIAFLFGICTVLFDVFYVPYLPILVQREQLADGNGKLQISASIAVIAGPGLTGLLMELLSGTTTMLFSILMFLCSAASLLWIRHREMVPVITRTDKKKLSREIQEGFAYIYRQPFIQTFTRCAVLWNLAWYSYITVFILFMTANLHLKAATTGFIFAFLGIGSLLGALFSKQLASRFGVGKATLFTAVLAAAGSPFVLLVTGDSPLDIALLSTGQLLFGLGTTSYNIHATSLRQYITPIELQGKVNATIRFLTWGINPVGSLVGGFLGECVGLVGTLAISSIGFFIAVGSLFFSRLYRMNTLADFDHSQSATSPHT